MENKQECYIIFKYIKENIDKISDEERKFLIRYVASKSNLKEECYTVTAENFLQDIKYLYEFYQNCNDTSLVAKRLKDIVKLLDEYYTGKNRDLYDLSIELDKLYLKSGLPARNTDTVLKKIKRMYNYDEECKRNR